MQGSPCPEFQSIDAILGAGVYALVFYGEVVYIGQSKRMLARIYKHRNLWERKHQRKTLPTSGPFAGVKVVRFNSVAILPCKEIDLDRIEKQMIAKYRPKYNVRDLPAGKVKLVDTGFDFGALISTMVLERPLVRRRV